MVREESLKRLPQQSEVENKNYEDTFVRTLIDIAKMIKCTPYN